MNRIALVVAGVALALAAAAAGPGGLCEKCAPGIYIQNVGKCVECGARTSSGAFKLCRACSAKLGQCMHCRAPLAAAAAPAAGGAAAVEAGPADDGGTKTVPQGGVLRVTLPSNVTTGYRWAVASLQGGGLRAGGDRYENPRTAPGMVGAPGRQVFDFNAAAAGTNRLEMAYARPWEKDAKPAEVFRLTVIVTAP